MNKEINDFIVFCIEFYKNKQNLSGKDVYELFSKYGVINYLENGYEVLHTQGKDWLMEDIDKYLENRGYGINN